MPPKKDDTTMRISKKTRDLIRYLVAVEFPRRAKNVTVEDIIREAIEKTFPDDVKRYQEIAPHE